MYRIISKLILFCLVLSFAQVESNAYAWGSKTLVTINGREFTIEDYENWWLYMNNGIKTPLPDNPSPEEFVDFHLMAQQALDMEYHDTPSFKHKIEVFLKVRAMMILKDDEVDSKIKVTDRDVKKDYEERYTPVWSLQILTYSDMEKARQAYEELQPFNGQMAGKLIFADLQGKSIEDGGPVAYEEANVAPVAFETEKLQGWLERIKGSKEYDLIEPFQNADNPDKVILLRVDAVKMPPEDEFNEIKWKLEQGLVKKERGRLTGELVSKLTKKYNVSIDEKLLEELNLTTEYPQDYLKQKVVAGDGIEISVELLLHNWQKNVRMRGNFLQAGKMKEFVLNSIMSQLLIDLESLNRGYEKEPPLKWGYQFYRQNRLKAEIDKDLLRQVSVADEDVVDYYNKNQAEFSTSGQVVYESLEGDEDLIKKIWTGILSGSKLDAVAEKYSKTVSLKNIGMNEIPEALKGVLDDLVLEEISKPVAIGGGYVLVKLLKRVPPESHPLEKVRKEVERKVRDAKFAEVKAAYLQQLKTVSTIDLNTDVWEKLVREYNHEEK